MVPCTIITVCVNCRSGRKGKNLARLKNRQNKCSVPERYSASRSGIKEACRGGPGLPDSECERVSSKMGERLRVSFKTGLDQGPPSEAGEDRNAHPVKPMLSLKYILTSELLNVYKIEHRRASTMCDDTHSKASPSLSAFQSILEQIDSQNRLLESPPSVDHLLEYTHTLSHSLSNTLHTLVRAVGGCDAEAYEYVKIAIDNATDSITTLRILMLEIHHLRKQNAER